MQNVTMQCKGDKLVITVDLAQRHGLSKTGKTEVVASSRGNAEVPGHPQIRLGLNVFAYREEKAA